VAYVRRPNGSANPTDAYKEALEPARDQQSSGDKQSYGDKLSSNFSYGPFTGNTGRAVNFNHWPAGLDSLAGYVAGMSADQLRRQLVERPTTYLLGQVDVLPLGGFDSSPNAMAQGPTRRARGEAFYKYVTETMGAKNSKAIIVPECGHNDRCIFTTDIVFPVIFPK
jgi:hypothetical protein